MARIKTNDEKCNLQVRLRRDAHETLQPETETETLAKLFETRP